MNLNLSQKKLANKISLIISLGLSVVFVVVTVLSVVLLRDRLKNDFEERLGYILDNFSRNIAEPMWDYDEDQVKRIADSLKGYKFIDHITIYNDSEKRIYHEGNYNEVSSIISVFALKSPKYFKPVIFTYKGKDWRIGEIKLGVNFNEQNQFIQHFVLFIFTVSLALFICLVIFIHKITAKIISPIAVLTDRIVKMESNVVGLSFPNIESDVVEITNLNKALLFLKEHYENYQAQLEYTVADRTAEIEEYKQHLEELVQEQTREIAESRDEAIEANNAKTEFLANMSHEVRTPMHAIINYSDMGIEKTGKVDNEKILKYFTNINSASKRLLNLINQILDISKLESGSAEINYGQHSFTGMVSDVCEELQPLFDSKKIRVNKEFSEISNTSFDKEKIYRVILNLISNAVKFTPEGSELILRVKRKRINNDVYVEFSILDEGPGIPESEVKKIFDKFYQSSKTKTGAGGTGLGLSICAQIINLHGGEIRAQNRTDKTGAEFIFYIPVLPIDNHRNDNEGDM